MKISVIVPVYNVEKYLSDCIKSITKQTFSDFELLLIDDGSTDASGALCDAAAQRDRRIEVTHKDNGGVSSARNAGILAAKGEYVCFVDGDDMLDEDALLSFMHVLDDNPDVDFILGCMAAFGDESDGSAPGPNDLPIDVMKGLSGQDAFTAIIGRNKRIGLNTFGLYRREYLSEHKFTFPEGMSAAHLNWALGVFYCNGKAAANSFPSYRYRTNRPGSLSESQAARMAIDTIRIFRFWADFLTDKKNRENLKPAFRRAVQRELGRRYVNMICRTSLTIPKADMETYCAWLGSVTDLFRYVTSPKYILLRYAMVLLPGKMTVGILRAFSKGKARLSGGDRADGRE